MSKFKYRIVTSNIEKNYQVQFCTRNSDTWHDTGIPRDTIEEARDFVKQNIAEDNKTIEVIEVFE